MDELVIRVVPPSSGQPKWCVSVTQGFTCRMEAYVPSPAVSFAIEGAANVLRQLVAEQVQKT